MPITLPPTVETDDPRIRAIARRVARTVNLAAEKAVASTIDPKKFKLPSQADSLERILRARFDQLPKHVQAAAKAKVVASLAAPAGRRARALQELAAVDLTSATPVEAQVDALGPPPGLTVTAEMLSSNGPVEAASGPPNKRLALRIDRVVCRDETNGFLGSEAGSDEIALGATTVDESGDTDKVAQFKVASFGKDGDAKVFTPPRQLTFFNVLEGKQFPKSYFVTLVLAERDMGGLADFLNQLTDKIHDRVIAELTKLLGGAVGTAAGGPIGAAIGIAVSIAVTKAFDLLKEAWSDDIFKPRTVSARLDSPTDRFDGGKPSSGPQVATFKGHGGEYQVIYDWLVTT